MKESIRSRYEARAKILKAMAHPSRLLIIEELQKKERCVNELTAMVGADTSTVSKHLSVLRNAGLVIDEKRANCIYYTLRCTCIL
ncbi:MAG TPA: metalloregulator ArsR/SmtB family transcription factor, partial [Smithellaceae bacterium]|nr:metalloregulator ArsR/SmtB family transcription factor [Smithellaceae bacterium]